MKNTAEVCLTVGGVKPPKSDQGNFLSISPLEILLLVVMKSWVSLGYSTSVLPFVPQRFSWIFNVICMKRFGSFANYH